MLCSTPDLELVDECCSEMDLEAALAFACVSDGACVESSNTASVEAALDDVVRARGPLGAAAAAAAAAAAGAPPVGRACGGGGGGSA